MGTLLPDFRLKDAEQDDFFFSMGKSESTFFWADDSLTMEVNLARDNWFYLYAPDETFTHSIIIKPDGKLIMT